jgi:hypothetical protein
MNDQAQASAPLGHLARLVERLAPAEPTLRRRQPALFEGAHTAPAEPMPDAVDTSVSRMGVAPVFAEPATSPRPTHNLPAPTQAPKLSPLRPLQDPPTSAAATPAAAPHEALRVDSTVRIVMTEAPARAVSMASLTAFAPAAAVRATVSRPEQPAGPAAARSLLAPALEHETAPRPRRAPELPADALVAHSRAVARAASVATPAPPKSTATLPAALSPRNAARRQAATAPPPAPRAAARELPPVEVTIGRIEVRAVTSAPATPRSHASAPRLSLDDYLRSRGGQR